MTLAGIQSASARGARLDVVRAGDGHAAQLAEFIREVWDPQATAASVLASRAAGAARNPAEPGVAPPTWIALQAGKAIGYVSSIPIRLWDGRRDWPAYWIKGLMVLPAFRNGPIGYLLVKAAAAELPRTGALAVAPPARRLFEALGYRGMGAIPNWVRPLEPGRILRRLDLTALGLSGLPKWAAPLLQAMRRTGLAGPLGWVGGALLRGWAWGRRWPTRSADAGPLDAPPAAGELDALWSETRGRLPTAVRRDAGYLLDRYPAGIDTPYVWVAARNGGRLGGVAILRRPRADGDPRLRGLQVAALADLLYPPGDRATGLALLGAVERVARRLGADAIVATSSAHAVAALLRSQGYLATSGNVHLLLRDVTGDGAALGTALTDWWLTRGDGLADEVF